MSLTFHVENLPGANATDRIFRLLYDRIVELDLLPGTKLSEIEVARQFDVSRQPVRDAFFRLSALGLLTIRPQRATVISRISPEAVLQASYIRTAIEVETVRAAARWLPPEAIDRIETLLEGQEAAERAGDKVRFHELDDRMHRAIFEGAGKGFAWRLVRDNKAHMDRVRFISLAFGARSAWEEHRTIMDCILAHDPRGAEQAMRAHLGKIGGILERAKADRPELFELTRSESRTRGRS